MLTIEQVLPRLNTFADKTLRVAPLSGGLTNTIEFEISEGNLSDFKNLRVPKSVECQGRIARTGRGHSRKGFQVNRRLKDVLSWVTPYAAVKSSQQRAARKRELEILAQFAAVRESTRADVPGYSYSAAAQKLVDWGLDARQLVAGSMPEMSLALSMQTLEHYLPRERPLIGLHVGNFVGMSLCYFLDWLERRNDGSLQFSVDPNITHRGIENPQQFVIRLAHHFGFTRQHVLITGYSLEKNIGEFDPADVENMAAWLAGHADESSPENVLLHLQDCKLKFDFVVMDGNHDAAYLARELDALKPIVADPALLIFDDVNEHWGRIEELFDVIPAGSEYVQVARDGRIGILLKQGEGVGG